MDVRDCRTVHRLPSSISRRFAERRPGSIGHITLRGKCAGARSAGKPHAACDVAGAGNGLTVWLVRHSHRKRGETDRPRLRSTAPALDPTPKYGVRRGVVLCRYRQMAARQCTIAILCNKLLQVDSPSLASLPATDSSSFRTRPGGTFPIGSKSRCVLYQCTPSCAKTRTATVSPSAGLRPLARSQTQTLSC